MNRNGLRQKDHTNRRLNNTLYTEKHATNVRKTSQYWVEMGSFDFRLIGKNNPESVLNHFNLAAWRDKWRNNPVIREKVCLLPVMMIVE